MHLRVMSLFLKRREREELSREGLTQIREGGPGESPGAFQGLDAASRETGQKWPVKQREIGPVSRKPREESVSRMKENSLCQIFLKK